MTNNKCIEIIEKIKDLFNVNKVSSKDIARERLKLVLFHDRADIPPEKVELIRLEIMEILKKHMEISDEEMEFKILKNDEDRNSPTIVANIPLKNLK